MTNAEIAALRLSCHTILPGHKLLQPAEQFAAMAQWCDANHVTHDTYGEGELVQDFEKKIATLLGKEAALFCITGTMTQVTALRLACTERGSNLVGLHATSHILVHENSNHQVLQHFNSCQLGNAHRPWTVDDLQAFPEKIGAVQYELPMREIGGQLPTWEQLDAIKVYCKQENIHLHMDGARLWEAQSYYGRPLHEIADGFDTVYVSFYKGIGGLGGAMLLGSEKMIAKASLWMRRQGGNVFRRTPYVVAAAMQFDQRIADMPALFQRTQSLYQLLKNYPQLHVNPAQPQANMLHLYLPVTKEQATGIRNDIAKKHGIWLFGNAVHTALPDQSMFEWYVGDQLLQLPDEQLLHALDVFVAALETTKEKPQQ
ncbi:threonine aldolase family protein [Undibacterium sp. RuTC16W]|uniref:threonine aldolase family protein n=1 Tax=Undibacterium sp. RuTC16W TaxID=3413048 RepID=UPI003BF323EB